MLAPLLLCVLLSITYVYPLPFFTHDQKEVQDDQQQHTFWQTFKDITNVSNNIKTKPLIYETDDYPWQSMIKRNEPKKEPVRRYGRFLRHQRYGQNKDN